MIERGFFDASIGSEDQSIFIGNMDFALLPAYVAFILVVFLFLRIFFVRDRAISGFFMLGLAAHLFGAILLGLLYQYYYQGGDTTLYYQGGKAIYTAFKTDFSYVQAIYRSAAGNPDPMITQLVTYIPYFRDPNGFFTVKIMGIFVIPAFGLYLPAAVLNAAFWYPGSWLLFITFRKICPNRDRLVALCTLFVPSVVFWGSGILKDTITLGALGYLTYGLYHGFILRKRILISASLVAFGAYLLINIKAYILLSYLPGALLWGLITYGNRIESPFLKRMFIPLIFMVTAALSAVFLTQASGAFEKYTVQNALETANTFQVWHSYLATNESASGYSLGVSATSTGSVALSFLPAVATTLFRPFLWEIRNPVMLLSGIESFLFLIITITILRRVGVRTFFSEIFRDPFLFFCFFYVLLFGFAVGYTAYNFGALVRYKIPCIPFYGIMLIILNYRSLEIKAAREKLKADQKARRNRMIELNRRWTGKEELEVNN